MGQYLVARTPDVDVGCGSTTRSNQQLANQIVSALVFGAALALPVIAAVIGNPLWLFARLPWLVAWPEVWRAIFVDPKVRLQDFEAAHPSRSPQP